MRNQTAQNGATILLIDLSANQSLLKKKRAKRAQE